MSYFKNLSLRSRVLWIVGFACVICMGIAVVVARHFIGDSLHTSIIDKSRAIHSRLAATTEYVANQGGLKPIIDRMTSTYKSPDELSKESKLEILKQVPIFAAMQVGAKGAEQEHYNFRVFSDEPRNKDNLANPEELAILKRFEQEPTLGEIVTERADSISVYKPVRLAEAQGCLFCHGHPSRSPWKNGKDVLGYAMEDWKDGKLHGVFTVTTQLDQVKAVQARTDKLLIVFIGAGALLALFLASIGLRGTITAVDRVIEILSRSNQQVGGTTDQVTELATRLSEATTKQAASLEETVSALNETSSMVAKNSDNSVSAAKTSIESNKKAENGKMIVGKMVESMAEINESNRDIQEEVNRGNAEIAEIVQVIEEIGSKTKVINDIVFQTKLLSFNASVEAARAGEHGKGFAVVAEEVGNLAQMSGNASKEISDLLSRSTERVQNIVQKTKTNVERLIASGKAKVDAGSQIATECSDTLNEIMTNSGMVSQMVSEISAASQEQSHGIDEINKAMSLLNQVTQENAGISDRTAEVSKDLSQQAESLKTAVQQLVLAIQGAPQGTHATLPLPSRGSTNDSKKVVAISKRKKTQAESDIEIPSSDDHRFKDIG